ncbi:high-temperature-induced dauer-formation protein-domain-containing protein [Melampsora americana]|nr:high-temperature-induced dauer-formation protein-domain-containing protein [Melampsora americana]
MAKIFEIAKQNLGLSSDPKLNFRSTTLTHLYTSPKTISISETSYWSIYSTIFDFASDVPILISSSDIRKAIRDRPRNVANLLHVLIHKLDELVHSQTTRRDLEEKDRGERGAEDPNTSGAFTSQWKGFSKRVPSTLYQGAANIVGVGSNGNIPKGPLREILNCVRVLTRILPFLMDNTPLIDPSMTSPTSAAAELRLTGQPEWSKPLDKSEWVYHLFWESHSISSEKDDDELASAPERTLTPVTPQFVIDEEEEETTETSNLNPSRPDATDANPSSSHVSSSQQPPLFSILLDTIADLLFLPGLCVPASTNGIDVRYPIWTGGIGCSQLPLEHRQAHNSAKVEVLRLLLVALSQPLYRPPHLYGSGTTESIPEVGHPLASVLQSPNPALTYFSTKPSKPFLLSLLCSLLNTSLAPSKTPLRNSANALTNIATGLGKMAQEKMGFSSSISPTSTAKKAQLENSPTSNGPRRPSLTTAPSSSNLGGASQATSSEGLASWCAELLCLLILPELRNKTSPPSSTSFQTIPLPVLDASQPMPAESKKVTEANGFRLYLSKLHRPNDLNFLLDHLLAIITKPMGVTSQLLLPDAVSSTASASSLLAPSGCDLTEAVMMLFVALDCNSRLLPYLTSSRKIIQLVIALVFICLEQKDAPKPKMGLVRVCGILLQVLTAKELGLLVNEKVELPVGIRARYSVPGSLVDFLTVSICSIIFSTNKEATVEGSESGFTTIYPSLVITITNMSPYMKGLGSLASARLAQLLTVFSAPRFLLREDANVRLLYYLLEAFNNVIHYQMSDNSNLIYALIRVHHRFDYLATFTLQDGLRDIQQRNFIRRSSEILTTAESARSSLGSDRSKGKGKMKEREGSVIEGSINEDCEEELLPPPPQEMVEDRMGGNREVTAVSVGRNGFVPTETWVTSWRDSLPLDTIQIMITELKPKLSSITPSTATENTLTLLSSATLVGHLPPPTKPKSRSFNLSSTGALSWVGGLVWSLIFLKDSNSQVGYLNGIGIELFGVKHLNNNKNDGSRLAMIWKPFVRGSISGDNLSDSQLPPSSQTPSIGR